MKTKTKRVPFSIELAKQVKRGIVKGCIKCDGGENCTSDIAQIGGYLQAWFNLEDGEYLVVFEEDGKCISRKANVYIELVEEEKQPQFKPFDKVLVRDENDSVWRANIFSHFIDDGPFPYACAMFSFKQCIPYEGHEDLVGTTNKPKED